MLLVYFLESKWFGLNNRPFRWFRAKTAVSGSYKGSSEIVCADHTKYKEYINNINERMQLTQMNSTNKSQLPSINQLIINKEFVGIAN